MPRDLRQLLHDTAVEPARDPDVGQLVRRGRRRRRVRHTATGLGAAAAVLVGVAIGVNVLTDPTPPQIIDQPPSTAPTTPTTPTPTPTSTSSGSETEGDGTQTVTLPAPTTISLDEVAELPSDGLVLETARGLVMVAPDLSATWELPGLSLGTWLAWIDGAQVQGAAPGDTVGSEPSVVDVGPFPVVDADGSSPEPRWWVAPGGGVEARPDGPEAVELVGGLRVVEDVDAPEGERLRVLDGSGAVVASFDESAPVAVSSDRRFVTSLVDGARPFVDADMGGTGQTDPGCWYAAGLGDLSGVQICDDGQVLASVGPGGRREVLATTDQLGVARFLGATYTDVGVVVQSESRHGRIHLVADGQVTDLGPGGLLTGRAGVATPVDGVRQGDARIAILARDDPANELRLVDPTAATDPAATVVVRLPDDYSGIVAARAYRFGHLWADQ